MPWSLVWGGWLEFEEFPGYWCPLSSTHMISVCPSPAFPSEPLRDSARNAAPLAPHADELTSPGICIFKVPLGD